MKRVHLPIAILAVATLGLVACGDDDGGDDDDDAPATLPGGVTVPDDITVPDLSIPDVSIPDISIPDVSIPDISSMEDASDFISQMFPNLTDDQIECLSEQGSAVDPNDIAASMDIFADCDIDLSDLGG